MYQTMFHDSGMPLLHLPSLPPRISSPEHPKDLLHHKRTSSSSRADTRSHVGHVQVWCTYTCVYVCGVRTEPTEKDISDSMRSVTARGGPVRSRGGQGSRVSSGFSGDRADPGPTPFRKVSLVNGTLNKRELLRHTHCSGERGGCPTKTFGLPPPGRRTR